MARERLTQKTAETLLSKPGTSVEEKDSGYAHDPYTMNNPEHEKNDPNKDEYVIGDPSKFGEDVNKDNLWKKDDASRDPKTNHPSKGEIAKSAAEAVKQAKQLEEKAVKCIIASQRILPGAPDAIVEEQATDLMYLPLQAVNAMLTRQEKLAMMIGEAAEAAAKTANDECEEDEKKEKEEGKGKEEGKEEDEGKEAGKKGEMPAGFAAMMKAKKEKAEGKKPEGEEEGKAYEAGKSEEEGKAKEEDKAKKDEKKDPMEEMEEKLAAMTAEFEKMKAEKGKGKAEEGKAEEMGKEARDQSKNDAFYTGKGLSEKEQTEGEKGKAKEATEVEASDSLIDDIFNSVMASDEKKGAKTLTGLVKKEASDGSGLDGVNLWGAPPDVSQHFDTRA